MAVRILLVDDHPVVRQGLRTLLEGRSEWEVVGEASDGIEALEKVGSLQPDVVVLDVTMPRMNGIELYDQLHATKGLEEIPAIVISARLPKREIEKRKILAMSKPLELDDFLNTIEKLLG